MNKSKEHSLLIIPPFGSSHNPFQSFGKITKVKFFFLYNVHDKPRADGDNRNVVVVVDGKNRSVEKKKKRTSWESEQLFFVVERASLPSSSLNIHDLRARNH